MYLTISSLRVLGVVMRRTKHSKRIKQIVGYSMSCSYVYIFIGCIEIKKKRDLMGNKSNILTLLRSDAFSIFYGPPKLKKNITPPK